MLLRRASAFASLVVIAVLVTSCSPRADQDRPTIEVFVPYLGADVESFAASVAPYEEATGVDVQIVGSGSFAGDIQDRVINADYPDVAMFPQPSLLLSFAAKDVIVPLPDTLQPASADDTLHTITDIGGVLHGIWFRAAVKSLVWYRPSEFTDRGYATPLTWDDLIALSDRMIADGVAPWCIGMQSFGSTGWVGTDWIEDIVLRMDGPALYDSWVTGDLPFESSEVRSGFTTFGSIIHTRGSVFGGASRVLNESWQSAPDPMFTDPVGCMMQRQASFWAPNLPDGSVYGEDFSVFVLPGRTAEDPPIIASGDIAGAFTDAPEVAAFMEFLAQPESGEGWADRGGFTSPHATFNPDFYASDFDREVGQILTSAQIVRFDGSDLMPPEVGTGTFWDGMRGFVANGDLSTILTVIDDSWPTTS
jgi:alpha-glucoside transport system substrate-binding protein